MILERLKEYIDAKGIAVSAFEKSIGMSNASFGKSLKNGGAIGTDKLENILKVYPDISPIWLLTGRGSMVTNGYDNDDLKPYEEQPQPYLIEKIAEQAEVIGRLKARVELLERRRGADASDAPSSAIAHAG